MATPSVWEEEGLRREDAAGATTVVGRTPWQLFWVRFRRDKVALAARMPCSAATESKPSMAITPLTDDTIQLVDQALKEAM